MSLRRIKLQLLSWYYKPGLFYHCVVACSLCRLRELHKYNQIIHLTSHHYTHCIILIGISIQSHESVSWRISTEHRHFRPTVMEPTEEDSVPLLRSMNTGQASCSWKIQWRRITESSDVYSLMKMTSRSLRDVQFAYGVGFMQSRIDIHLLKTSIMRSGVLWNSVVLEMKQMMITMRRTNGSSRIGLLRTSISVRHGSGVRHSNSSSVRNNSWEPQQ